MISVSLVEDNFYFRKAVVRCLQSQDAFLLKGIYADAEAALAGLIKYPPDIAIIDIEMSGMDGIELIGRLTARLPQTQFLVHTVCEDEETIFSALRAGATGYLLKDACCDGIGASVIELYRGGSPMSPYIARKLVQQFNTRLPADKLINLTAREHDMLRQLAKGLLYKEIASRAGISTFTVKNHLKNIYRKLQVQNKVEALNKYNAF